MTGVAWGGEFEGADAEHAEAWAVEELADALAMEREKYDEEAR